MFSRIIAFACGCSILFAASLWLMPPARADIPPPQMCTHAGAPCFNAGPDANREGICGIVKCRRPTPDGSIEYDCYICQEAPEPNVPQR